MAQSADLQSLLAALASNAAPPPAHAQQGPGHPPHNVHAGYPSMPPQSSTPLGVAGYALPQPTSSSTISLHDPRAGGMGGMNLHDIKPSSSGTINLQAALDQARGRASDLGVSYQQGRADPRYQQPYGRSRSRSLSPRRDSNYNPYRDERRDRRSNGYGRDRSRSRSPTRRSDGLPSAANRGQRDRSPRRDDSEIITMDPGVVGLVIGRQGENLKRIERMTSTKIQFLTGPGTDTVRRQCRIDGPARNREDAKREIFRVIDENDRNKQQQPGRGSTATPQTFSNFTQQDPPLKEGELSQQMMVPDKTVGLIIGRGGETIRDLQERSGCHINIVGTDKSIGGLRPVNLIGTVEAANRAKNLILEIVASDERPENQPQQQQASRMPGRAQNDSYAQPDLGKINKSIYVPSEAVGMIIGKGGETIKDMQNTTACKINVSQPSGADHEREIGLIGTRPAIEAAERAIWDKVAAVREKSGGANRGTQRRDDGYADRYQHLQAQQTYGQQQNPQSMPPTGAPNGGTGDPNAADPYAQWGGYNNYVAWYFANMVQQQQGAAQGGAPSRPPGA